jgi:transposase, IS5 family
LLAKNSQAAVMQGRILVYAANPRRVFISGQKRGVFGLIKRELRRRSAIEAGYNLRLILAWLRVFVMPHPDSAHTSLHDPVTTQISLLTDD